LLKKGGRKKVGDAMASVIRKQTKTGVRYDVQLSPGENEARPKISLGGINKKQAETAKTNIESLINCNNTGSVISPAVQEWLNGISDGLRKRLRVLGVINSDRSQSFTVAEWVQAYIQKRTDVKAGTKKKWQDVESKLTAFFRGQLIDGITTRHAKDFRVYLKSVVGLAENTTRGYISTARQFFNAAVDAEFIDKNPFHGQSVSQQANPERFFFVTQQMAVRVLEACPNAQWRLIFGLSRWGGLRCPSEVLRLKWQDVDFEHDRFTVHASKTEHHAGAGIRTVPMFPELKPLFQEAFDNAKEGAIYCLDRYKGKWSNLGVHMARIVKHAGLEPWPKIFQNMRSTRETELFKMTGGNVKAVCSWIGNSPKVALKHYAQVTEADFQEAAKMTLLNNAEKRVQNRVQTTAAQSRKESQELQNKPVLSPYSCEAKRELATPCETMQKSIHSGRQDLNLRPLRPERSALAKLSYSPAN
jgi:integrase